MPDWLDIMLVLAAVSAACLHLGWRWLRGHNDVTVAIGLNTTLDAHECWIVQELRPAPQVAGGLNLLRGQFNSHGRHGANSHPIPSAGQSARRWALGVGRSTLDVGRWTFDVGRWT